jgi:TRAP-type mannitol/chloroaromatic compound transport system permease small subunit
LSQEPPTPVLLSNLHRVWFKVEDACAGAAALLIAAAMVLTVAEVLSRRLLNAPLPGIICAVGVASAEGVVRAYRVGDATMDLLLPVWPAKALVTLALMVLAVRLTLQFFDSLRLAITPEAVPVAALRVATVEELAREEIEEVIGTVEPEDVDRGDGA